MFRENRAEKLTTLGTLCFALFMVLLDSTIVNVALPTISGDLNTGVSGLQWVADAFTLALATCVLTGGTLGDRFGRKRMFLIGLTVFTVGSFACGVAPSIGALIASRALQGVGAAILLPSTLGILAPTFPDPRERATAIGIWAGVSGTALGAGPLIGGLIVNSGDWRGVFFINIPIGIIAFAVAVRTLHESRVPGRRVDLAGQATAIIGLGTITYALIDGEARGWTSPLILTSFAIGIAAIAMFVTIELNVPQPMLQLTMFRSRVIASAHVVRILLGFSLFSVLFFGSLYFQEVLGYTPLEAGVRWAPATAALALAGPFAGRLSGVIGPRPLVAAGMAIAAVGMLLFSTATVSSSYASLWWHMVLIGAGLGMCLSPLTAVVLNSVPKEQIGMASSSVNAAQQTGSVLGIAILGVVVTTRMDSAVRAGLAAVPLPSSQKAALRSAVSKHALGVSSLSSSANSAAGGLVRRAFVDGMQAGTRISSLVLAIGACLALAFLPGMRRAARSEAAQTGVTKEQAQAGTMVT
jgi:EmrB/QacA subfamily drug resistance transporter